MRAGRSPAPQAAPPFQLDSCLPQSTCQACGEPCGLSGRIGWALAHHELHTCLGCASSRCCWKRGARAFGQPFGLPESLSLAWPRESNQREGHPSSAPSAHPCAEGSRVSAGVRGQCIPALSRTSPASLPAPLRADRPSLAAPQGPREERGLLPAEAGARADARSEKREARVNTRDTSASHQSTRRAACSQRFPIPNSRFPALKAPSPPPRSSPP